MTKIFVISHKKISEDLGNTFTPIYVGAEGANPSSGLSDRTGDSIAEKNANYSELTAQYWVWKNILPKQESNEPIGFCHYRRFFTYDLTVEKLLNIPSMNHDEEVSRLLLQGHDVILSKPTTFPIRQHWFSRSKFFKTIKFPWESLTLLEQFELEHDKQDILLAASLLPQPHKDSFIQYLNGYSFSPYNMYIAKPEILNEFFNILFPWLFEFEKRTTLLNRTPYQARLPGFIAERFSSYYFNLMHTPALSNVSFIKQ